MKKQKNNSIIGFEPISFEEKERISAGNSVSSIVSSVTSGISSLASIADNISDTVIKNKIVSKIDDVQKGEVELGKDGQLRLKWDSLSSSSEIKNSIVF